MFLESLYIRTQFSLPSSMLQCVKSLSFYIPSAWKRPPFWAEPSHKVHCREYLPLPHLPRGRGVSVVTALWSKWGKEKSSQGNFSPSLCLSIKAASTICHRISRVWPDSFCPLQLSFILPNTRDGGSLKKTPNNVNLVLPCPVRVNRHCRQGFAKSLL